MADQPTTCFIGAGSMTEALLSGLLSRGMSTGERITIMNRRNHERVRQLARQYGVILPADRKTAVSRADIIILAIKPKDVAEALEQWGRYIHPGQRVISVIAGISTSFIEDRLTTGTAVIRAMPNTSGTVGLSATALCPGRHAGEADLEEAARFFSSIGITVVVKEEDMDAVTGLSGSGPAYIYYLVEALEKAGVTMGLTPAVSRRLTLQTLLGAAKMLQETGEEPAELRRKVSSPGGTTMAGLETLARHRFQDALILAVQQACRRSRELGRSSAGK
ncbi:pyrroline-5-carboxylate reductase [Kroppenstedtia eburnea]|uniref:Pyrroline-5-carboxylate reductase n=1 Tax=Kroppenstedtia eburnea TaxID=714067 RepID=A0A1N7PMF7_9BACL|nr:pyrroline-5-carboxylate reductase [Kroppenstedtia eburnea]QKI83230.1 pyrroline-5-carboxylate reductase [Kroppenstedtia eburnea]SIT11710.1 pyrroline-5-carboxylate reductase [Kroppenstedtia eburnea]